MGTDIERYWKGILNSEGWAHIIVETMFLHVNSGAMMFDPCQLLCLAFVQQQLLKMTEYQLEYDIVSNSTI